MSRKKENAQELRPFESRGRVNVGGKERKDTFTRICESLIQSEAFISLPEQIKSLYVCMRLQEYGKRKPERDFTKDAPQYEKLKSDLCFYYPLSTAIKYNPKYKNNSNRLYSDIDKLVEHGFIEKIMSGHNTRTKSVYKYSSKWQTWGK